SRRSRYSYRSLDDSPLTQVLGGVLVRALLHDAFGAGRLPLAPVVLAPAAEPVFAGAVGLRPPEVLVHERFLLLIGHGVSCSCGAACSRRRSPSTISGSRPGCRPGRSGGACGSRRRT